MKESTKHKKAIAEFKEVAKSCEKSGCYVSLADHLTIVAGNNYMCTVIMEANECLIYEVFYSNLTCSKIGSFKL